MHPRKMLIRAVELFFCLPAERNHPESCREQTRDEEYAQLAACPGQQDGGLFLTRLQFRIITSGRVTA